MPKDVFDQASNLRPSAELRCQQGIAVSARLGACKVRATSCSAKLAELDSSHECGQAGLSQAIPTAWPSADSANARPQTGAPASAGEAGSAAFLLPEIETKIDPEMGFLVLFEGSRVAMFAPSGEPCRWLSRGLSQLALAVGPATARKYAHAVRRLCDAASADIALITQLSQSCESAQRAITKMLVKAGCRFPRRRLHGGALLVQAPETLVATIDAALTALSHCYDLLGDRGDIAFANPVQCAEPVRSPLPESESHRPHRHFVVANRPRSRPLMDDPHCSTLVREAARRWPAGVRAAAHLTADHGNRINETLALNCQDYAASGFGDWIACPNKGSRGARTKRLYLDERQQRELFAYIDGPRREMTGIGMAELRRLARSAPEHPALAAPLFLNTRGRRISYSLFNDYYFRPALRALGSLATPHWMRHEMATDGLLAIRHIARGHDDEERLVATFANLKGWATGAAMVRYYAASLEDADQRALQRQLTGVLRSWSDGGDHKATPMAAAPVVSPAFAAFLAGRLP